MALWSRPGQWPMQRHWAQPVLNYGAAQLGTYVRRRAASAFSNQNQPSAKRRRANPSGPLRRRVGTAVPGRVLSARSGSRRIFKNRRSAPPMGGISKKLRKTIKGIAGSLQDSQTNTWRNVYVYQPTFAANKCLYFHISMGKADDLETAITTTRAPFLDTDGHGIGQYDAADSTLYNQQIKFLNMKAVTQLRNNGQMPVKMQVWWCTLKKDTDTAPETALGSVDIDNSGATWAVDDPRYYPFDSPGFRTLYQVFRHQKYLMNAGDEVILTADRTKPFWYRPRDFALDSLQLRKGITQVMFIRMEGVPCHDDSTTTNVGLSDGTIDTVTRYHYKWVSSISDVKHVHVHEGAGDFGTVTTAVVAGPDVEEIKEAL